MREKKQFSTFVRIERMKARQFSKKNSCLPFSVAIGLFSLLTELQDFILKFTKMSLLCGYH